MRDQQLVNKAKWRSDIGAVNGNCTIRCKFFVQNPLANGNAEFFRIRQAQSVPLPAIDITTSSFANRSAIFCL